MDDLKEKLSALQIQVLSSDDGLTVISESEPAFCFVRETQEQIAEVVASTLQSYAKNFYGLDVKVQAEVEKNQPVRTVKLRSEGRIHHTLTSRFNESSLACA